MVVIGFVFCIIIIFCVIIYLRFQRKEHIEQIEETIQAMGGTVNSISENFFSTGPFLIMPKGSRIYEIDYELNGEEKTGWVRLGFMEKWLL